MESCDFVWAGARTAALPAPVLEGTMHSERDVDLCVCLCAIVCLLVFVCARMASCVCYAQFKVAAYNRKRCLIALFEGNDCCGIWR